MAKETKKRIEPTEWYTLSDIVQGRLFKLYKSFESVRRVIQEDRRKRNLLKAIITGKGRGTKYHIKGANINKFLEAWESGSYRL